MPTFLTTPKMSPELKRRVEASLKHRRVSAGKALAPRSVSLLRFAGIGVLMGIVVTVMAVRAQEQAELERDRATILKTIKEASEGISKADKTLVPRLHHWLERASAETYAGDHIDPSLHSEEAFSAHFERPTVYLRAPIEAAGNRANIAEEAAQSYRDAFVLCLLDPPNEKSEKALLSRARLSLAGAAHSARMRHITRHHELLTGLPLLLPEWQERVRTAKSAKEVAKLERALEKAPIQAAKRGTQAELALFVIDERKHGSGPTELDGAYPHHVRVELREIKSGKVLLRLRRYLDPEWISAPVRAEYARSIQACGLAYDIRQHVGQAVVAESKP